MNAEMMASRIAGTAPIDHRAGGLWLRVEDLDVHAMARVMREEDMRFVTLTVVRSVEGSLTVMYHWDIDGELLTVSTPVVQTAVSIADIWPAADWIERETRDYYAVEFAGRECTPPLMLRDGDEAGLFLRTESAGRGADPAYTDKTGEVDR